MSLESTEIHTYFSEPLDTGSRYQGFNHILAKGASSPSAGSTRITNTLRIHLPVFSEVYSHKSHLKDDLYASLVEGNRTVVIPGGIFCCLLVYFHVDLVRKNWYFHKDRLYPATFYFKVQPTI